MKNNPSLIVSIVLYVSLFLAFGFLYSGNPTNRMLIISMMATFTIIQIFRYTIWPLTKIPEKQSIQVILISFQLLSAFAIQIIDGSFVPQIYLFILIAEIAYVYRLMISIPFLLVSYFAFSFGVYIHEGFPVFEEISFVIPRMLEYWLIFGFSYMAKRATEQSEKLEQAYKQLQIANNELEEKIIIEERVRLSREIHDTIGHTLTTTLIGIEASKQLNIHGKIEQAAKKLDSVKDQVKQSLQYIRKASKTLHDNTISINFITRLKDLIENTIKQSDIDIIASISDIPQLRPDQELTIYRALQEGLTNGMRHGNVTKFYFDLKEIDNHIHFQLTDNGTSVKNIRFGFGLTAMQERVNAINGLLKIIPTTEGACSLQIKIPIHSDIKLYNTSNKREIPS